MKRILAMKQWKFWKTNSSAPRRRRSIANVVERLEDRVLLSGNIVAQIADGNLHLKGDDHDNLVEVALVGGDVVVRGLDGTTVNGDSSFVAFTGTDTIPDDLISRLGVGDDTLVISQGLMIGDDLKVYDREGATTLGLEGVVVGDDIQIRTSNEADEISIASTEIGGDIWNFTRNSDDLMSVFDSKIGGSIRGFTASGEDDLVVQESQIQHGLLALTGKGDDDVVIQQSSVDGFLSVWTWRDDDFVLLEESDVGHHSHFWLQPGEDVFVSDDSSTSHSPVLERLKRKVEERHPRLYQHLQWMFGTQPQDLDDVDPDSISMRVTDPETGAVARAEALRQRITTLISSQQTPALPPPTFDLSTNAQTSESNGTLVTKLETVTVSGETTPFADIEIGQQGGGTPATTTADENGQYTVVLDLNPGQQTVVIQATDSSNQTAESQFEIYRAVGSVVRFSSSLGDYDIELFDDDAPKAVENFFNYQQRFENSIIHRAPTDFVIQGGGFVFENDEIRPIVTDPPVENEFDPSNSNLRGTLSMALQSGQPDSGTSGWFINVVDNAGLDAAEHTVFGRVIGDGMDVVDSISAIPIYNLNPFENPTGGAFGSLPLINYTELSQPLTGAVAVSPGSNVVTGNGTNFTSELSVGDKVRLGSEVVFVLSVVSDTEFTILTAHTSGAAAVTAFVNPDPMEDNLVLFFSISEIL